jgi:hypothetical protein
MSTTKLYKATYHTVLYTADDHPQAIARELASESSPYTYQEESIEEILSEEDLPEGWETMHYPIINENGSFADWNIRTILQKGAETFKLKKRLRELEKELEETKRQLELRQNDQRKP